MIRHIDEIHNKYSRRSLIVKVKTIQAYLGNVMLC